MNVTQLSFLKDLLVPDVNSLKETMRRLLNDFVERKKKVYMRSFCEIKCLLVVDLPFFEKFNDFS